MQTQIQAVTFDFFNTLVFHRATLGRGRMLTEYLEAEGFDLPPWEHSFLYEMFGIHDDAYSPISSDAERAAYYVTLAGRVFTTLGIPSTEQVRRQHARAIWSILGPECLSVFPEVPEVLRALTARGLPMAVVSNWQRGLGHFCHELGLSDWFGDILTSAELGVAKPDPGIFLEACRRLGVAPARTLHIGDTPEEDYEGAVAAGMQVVLLARDGGQADRDSKVVRSLSEVLRLVVHA